MKTESATTPNITPTLYADGYKQSHRPQYPEGTEEVDSNWTPRSSRTKNKFVINFGLQYFLREYLIKRFNEDFFNRPKDEVIHEFHEEITAYLNNPEFDVSHIAALHDLGYLPLKIKALPEGARVPLQVPLFTLKNTKKEFFWVTNYIETILSCICWLPITSATTAFELRRTLEEYANKTVGNTEMVPWQAHDFSFRGMAGLEAALMSGAGHLTSFIGTDTIPAIKFLKNYYGATGLIGGSIPATEHSVMCAGGDQNELDTFVRLLTKVYPKGFVSVVSDTWDYFGVLTNILPKIKEIIMNRDGKLVIRPDSGDQFRVICGYKLLDWDKFGKPEGGLYAAMTETQSEAYKKNGRYYILDMKNYQSTEISEVEVKGTIQLLWELFGGTTTEKGYKLLDSHIGCILGDGVTPELLERILKRLEEQGFASYNMVFGIGSFTYQYVTRDTYGMAMKATYCVINGEAKEIFKNPKTSSKGFNKKSARGLLQVKLENGQYVLHDRVTREQEEDSELQTVFEDGKLVRETTLAEIRARVDEAVKAAI